MAIVRSPGGSGAILQILGPAVSESADRLLVQERGAGTYLAADGAAYSGPCLLKRVVVGTGAAGAITVYDNTAPSGTTVAVIDGTNPGSYEFGIAMANGIYIDLTTGQKITVVYEPI